MAKKNLEIEVLEATDGEARTINVTIVGAAEDFLLADLLMKRKRIQPIGNALKQGIQEVIKAYLESAEEVVSGVKSERTKDAPEPSESAAKPVKRGKEKGPKEEVRLEDLTAKTANGAAVASAPSRD